MSDETAPEGESRPGSEQTEAAESTEQERRAAAQADALAQMEDQWRRALADNDNLRKRAARGGAPLRAQERAAVSLAWLPVLDNLELALAHAPSPGDPLADGIAAIRS